MTAIAPGGRLRYAVLAALGLLYFLLMAATFNSLGQVLPLMVQDLGMSWAEAGFGFTLLGIACGISSLLPAMLIRALGVSLTLVAGTVMLIAGFAALAFAPGVLVYHAGTILLGLGFCFCGPVPAVHIISSIFSRRSSALGTYFTVGGLGAVGGPVFFYVVNALTGGWRVYWLFCAGASLIVGGIAALATRARDEPADPAATEGTSAEETGWTLRAALATTQFWVVVAAYTGCLLVNTTVHSFAFQHLMEHGQTNGSATAIISLAALIGVAGSAAAGVIGERVDGRLLTMLSLFMLSVAAGALAVAQGWLAVSLFAISMGIGLGFSYVGTAMLMHDYFGKLASLELYSTMTVVSTSAAIGPGIGGIVRDRTDSFSGVFAGLAAIALLLLAAVFMMRRPGRALGARERLNVG